LNTRTKRVRGLCLFVCAVLSACGQGAADVSTDPDSVDFGVAEQSARVSPAQAALAAQLVDSTRGYLPFAYTEDGCYARALYMSMELASRRVPSSAQYLTGYLQPSPLVQWGWHVAPMVEIDGSTGRTILDPSLAPQGPVALAEWVRRSNPQGSYELFWTLGSVYYLTGFYTPNAQAAPVIQSFAELAPFQRTDVESACAVMSEYLRLEGRADQSQKRALLLGRTRSLANRLLTVNKLNGYQAGAALSCGADAVPLCREATERCTSNAQCCSTLCGSTGVCQARPIDAAGTGPAPGVTDAGARVDAGVADAGITDAGTRLDAGFTDAGPRLDAGVVDAGVPGTALINGVAVTGLSGTANSTRLYRFEAAASSTLRFELRGSTGDADLYVRAGTPPTLTQYDARPYRSDSNETVTLTASRAGTWYVLVNAYSAYTGTSLVAIATP